MIKLEGIRIKMDSREKYLLIKTVQENNILPITSACGVRCQFCSHYQNPPEVDVYRFGNLKLDLIRELVDYISPGGPIILGESATRIIEGEPFIHPDFKKIILILRDRWPEKEIRITTHGGLLTKDIINFLEEVRPVVLNISLNCPTAQDRVFLMSDPQPDQVFKGLKLLRKSELLFHGSIVALPHLMDWENIKKTISLLAESGSKTVRVFLPGYTDYSNDKLKFSFELEEQLRLFVKKINEDMETPVIIEPPRLTSLEAIICGVIKGSPADKAGLKQGDVIKKINNETPFSRVEAFNKLNKLSHLEVVIERGNKEFTLSIEKEKEDKTGVVMNYDFSYDKLNEIQRLVEMEAAPGSRVGLITSGFASDMMEHISDLLTEKYQEKYKFTVFNVKNRAFGGSIKAVGLLSVDDIIYTIKEKMEEKIKLFILPGIIFDDFGKDLIGKDFSLIEEELGIKAFRV